MKKVKKDFTSKVDAKGLEPLTSFTSRMRSNQLS